MKQTEFNLELTFDEYQENTKKTAIYPKKSALEYLALGLTSEAGEFAGKVKKLIRDSDSIITPEILENLKSELGDVLWYTSELATHLNCAMSELAEKNLIKLKIRKDNNTIGGSGDNR